MNNNVCIPESFNTNISHQLFDYTITLVNSQHKNTNSKDDSVHRNWVKTFGLKFFSIQKYIKLRFGMKNSINKH